MKLWNLACLLKLWDLVCFLLGEKSKEEEQRRWTRWSEEVQLWRLCSREGRRRKDFILFLIFLTSFHKVDGRILKFRECSKEKWWCRKKFADMKAWKELGHAWNWPNSKRLNCKFKFREFTWIDGSRRTWRMVRIQWN